MTVSQTSRDAYYEQVLSGKATRQQDRIMRYMIKIGRPVTRHEMVENFFCVGNFPNRRALDGGPPIPLHVLCGRIDDLKGTDKQNPDYVMVSHEGPDPITGNKAQFLVPIKNAWDQRRMF